jgi:hypothetical protein
MDKRIVVPAKAPIWHCSPHPNGTPGSSFRQSDKNTFFDEYHAKNLSRLFPQFGQNLVGYSTQNIDFLGFQLRAGK